MTRLIGPDEASREVKAVGPRGVFYAKADRPAQLWADDAATIPADVLWLDGSAIPDSTVTIDSWSMLPLIQYPPGDVDFVVVTCDGGPPWRAYARTDDRLDALGARVGAIGAGPVSDITRDSQGRLTGYTEAGTVWSAITYDAAGRVASYAVNGTAHTVSYNAAGQIAGVS